MEVFSVEAEMKPAKENWGVPKRTRDVFENIQGICGKKGIDIGFVTGKYYQILLEGVVVKNTEDTNGYKHTLVED
jgi:hypothetical protein